MKRIIVLGLFIFLGLSISAQSMDVCIIEVWEVAPGSSDEKYRGSDDEDDTFYVTVDSRENSEAIKVYYAEYDIKGYYLWNDNSEKVYRCNNAFNWGIGLGNKNLGRTDDFELVLEWILEDFMECDHADIEWMD